MARQPTRIAFTSCDIQIASHSARFLARRPAGRAGEPRKASSVSGITASTSIPEPASASARPRSVAPNCNTTERRKTNSASPGFLALGQRVPLVDDAPDPLVEHRPEQVLLGRRSAGRPSRRRRRLAARSRRSAPTTPPPRRCRRRPPARGRGCARRPRATAGRVGPHHTSQGIDKAGRAFRIVIHQPGRTLRLTLQENPMSNWNTADIPDQTGRTAVITGANTGIGFETAAALAAKGAACRARRAQPRQGPQRRRPHHRGRTRCQRLRTGTRPQLARTPCAPPPTS